MSDGCQNYDKGQMPPRRTEAIASGSSSATGYAASHDGKVIADVMAKHTHDDRKMTTMEDAILMLDLWDTCICKNIRVQKDSPLHRLVKWTLEDMRHNDPSSATQAH